MLSGTIFLLLVWYKKYFHTDPALHPFWVGYRSSPGLPKKVVRPREDQRGESRLTSMWRTGFIRHNKMIQALPEQGSTFKYKRAGIINMFRPPRWGKNSLINMYSSTKCGE
ncbi:hypothetical protein AVEN_119130-1 [Araneus ventricosus]|uniref:Uncharacterized protein n=1 Tax=Araneus ventricosus TaxID=182803 RepID=A0A4Y2BMV2_ARAVE|nr:hypothetical protein AVEN_119130-1 [Araneus ventricosus]